MDGSPPSSSVLGIFQARVLEWGAIAFSDPVTKLPEILTKGTQEHTRAQESIGQD